MAIVASIGIRDSTRRMRLVPNPRNALADVGTSRPHCRRVVRAWCGGDRCSRYEGRVKLSSRRHAIGSD